MRLASAQGSDLTGLGGWVADVLSALGLVGVFVLTTLETLFPPIPSEVILPLSGYLASRGEISLVGAIVAATLGSVVGALALYEAGARLGVARIRRFAGRLPLVGPEDVDRAQDWFDRNGRASVFFGRFVPGVRSLVSIPAGTGAMSRTPFLLYTAAGSLIWNTLFVVIGWALGSSWTSIGDYSHWFDRLVVTVVLVGLARLWWTRRRPQSARGTEDGPQRPDPAILFPESATKWAPGRSDSHDGG